MVIAYTTLDMMQTDLVTNRKRPPLFTGLSLPPPESDSRFCWNRTMKLWGFVKRQHFLLLVVV